MPDVNRGRKKCAFNIGMCYKKKTDDEYFHLVIKNKIFKDLYSRSQFSLSPEKLTSIENILIVELLLRTVANKQFIGIGQGLSGKMSLQNKNAIQKETCM